MTKFHEMVPPFGSGWHWFVQATDPATDPNNYVGPGKLWIETDDDTAPTVVVAMHVWSVDDSAWLAFPIGSAGVVADADYGDIVVSGSGASWLFDSSVVTAAAKTVLDDASVAAMLATMGGAPLASPTFSGTPSLPTGTTATTQSAGDSTTKLATTAFVTTADNLKANLASPTFTGTPSLPTGTTGVTQSASDNSTKLATTAYVDTAAAAAGAPVNAQYLTLATNGTLTVERVLTLAARLSGTDAGAGSTYTVDLTNNMRDVAVPFVVDGGGVAITTGLKGDIEIPFSGTIVSVRTFSQTSGSIVLDLWKDTYANYPPTIADTITASAKPTLSSAQKSQDTTLTGWTTSVTAGDIIAWNVDSATTVTRVTCSLVIRRN